MNYLAKLNKRIFLKPSPDLMAMSFEYNLWTFHRPPRPGRASTEEELSKLFVSHHGQLDIFLRGGIITLHFNDLVKPHESLPDMIKKMNVILDVIKRARVALARKDKRYVDKRFLNDIEGISDIYTSTIAVTISDTHGTTFEISSCDRKGRVTLYGKEREKFFKEFENFISWIVESLEDVSAKHLNTLKEISEQV